MAGLIAGIAGLAIQAGTTAVSFAQANKEKNKQLEFQNEADKDIVSTKTEQGIANVLQKRGNVQQALLDMFTRDRGATMLKALAGL